MSTFRQEVGRLNGQKLRSDSLKSQRFQKTVLIAQPTAHNNNKHYMLGFDFQKIASFQRLSEQFEDLGKIGSGGFSNVHKVRNKLDMRIYALKKIGIRPSQIKEDIQEYVYRVLGEVKVHSSLSHPNVAQFNGCWIQLDEYSADQKTQCFQIQADEQPDFQMVVVDESFDSSEIVFGSSSADGQKQDSDKTEFSVNQQPSSFASSTEPHPDKNRLTGYKQINIYVLSELCSQNLQHHIHERNLQKKQKEARQQQTQDQNILNLKMAIEIIDGLTYLHSKNIIHRDIKLQNICLSGLGKCKIIDYGLAKKTRLWKSAVQHVHQGHAQENDQQIIERHSSSVGTKFFSSPEQTSSEKYDHRTDIYSLAIVILLLFSTFTTAHQQKQLLQNIRNKDLGMITMPEQLKAVLLKSLGAQNQRPTLGQIRKGVKQVYWQLMRAKAKDPRKTPFVQLSNMHFKSPLSKQAQQKCFNSFRGKALIDCTSN